MTLAVIHIWMLVFCGGAAALAGMMLIQTSAVSHRSSARLRCDLLDQAAILIGTSASVAQLCLARHLRAQLTTHLDVLGENLVRLQQLSTRLQLTGEDDAVEVINKSQLLLSRAYNHCLNDEDSQVISIVAKFQTVIERRKQHALDIINTRYQQALTEL
ncbi:hypothetical protein [uncultured Umboniibacter sp.]|uniref:hypothetical protein n=1 Tax=uncultured Umboniibacter sp. TaxID=1798917 RepID=UPI0026207EE0|nr:hypothetical protein [uncultured Umboniibacter sp.]